MSITAHTEWNCEFENLHCAMAVSWKSDKLGKTWGALFDINFERKLLLIILLKTQKTKKSNHCDFLHHLAPTFLLPQFTGCVFRPSTRCAQLKWPYAAGSHLFHGNVCPRFNL